MNMQHTAASNARSTTSPGMQVTSCEVQVTEQITGDLVSIVRSKALWIMLGSGELAIHARLQSSRFVLGHVISA